MIIDIIVISILLISGIIAFLRGLIREILTIAGVVGGLIAAYTGGPILIPMMENWLGLEKGKEPEKLFDMIPYDVLAVTLSYGLIFIVVLILLSIASHFLAESAKKLGLGAVDRTLGFIFGLIRGIIIVGILFIPAIYLDDESKETYLDDSKTSPYLEKTSQSMLSLLPQKTKQSIDESAQGISNDINKGLETREKLKEIDLLKEQRDRETIENKQAPSAETQGGYDEDFRDKMNQIFENNDSTAGKPAVNQ
ncbi:MAG: CvpA family protein [Micavibrio sp.]|nr:CvpA family protein [Micavibrio sp.]